MMKLIQWKSNMNKFKIGDKVIINRYGKPRVNGTVVKVPDGPFVNTTSLLTTSLAPYKVRLEDGNYSYSYEPEMISADSENYFYCPVCGKKTLIKDAVIRKYTLNKSFGLDNAAMPGWMKISASVDYCYIRVCPQCEAKPLSDDAFVRASDGNAIENRKGKIRAAENSGSGCMVLVGTIITAVSAACWILCMIM